MDVIGHIRNRYVSILKVKKKKYLLIYFKQNRDI